MSSVKIITDKISRKEVEKAAEESFGEMVKAVVDIKKGILALGGEMHSDEEAVLLETGSEQANLWGINIYPFLPINEWIEFDSMINIRPLQGNRSRKIENAEIRNKIIQIVNTLVS